MVKRSENLFLPVAFASAQHSFAQPLAAFACRPDCHAISRSPRGGSAGPAHGRESAAAKS
jgi:hypothetical protein